MDAPGRQVGRRDVRITHDVPVLISTKPTVFVMVISAIVRICRHVFVSFMLVVLPIVLGQVRLVGAAEAGDDDGEYTKTMYPIVLVHGAFGFPNLARFGYVPYTWKYWSEIPEALKAGGATVYLPHLSPLHSSEVRGHQLIRQLEEIQAIRDEPLKFNLICHSHGGHACRFAAKMRKDLIASVTTIATPHTGAPLADVLDNWIVDGWLRYGVATGFDWIGGWISWQVGFPDDPSDVLSALGEFTRTGSVKFNDVYDEGLPSQPCEEGEERVGDQHFYSWGGVRSGDLRTGSELVLAMTSWVFFGGKEANDGLVGRCSNHFGKVIRDDYPLNHFNIINEQFLGMGPGPQPKAIMRQHANRLKKAGL